MNKILLNHFFEDPLLDVMNFLNEVILRYPFAISFAPGRPADSLLDVEDHIIGIHRYIQREAESKGVPAEQVWQSLGQYNRTNGSINEVIAAQLQRDEGIKVGPESIMVTVGAQEALAVVLLGLLEPGRDVLLVGDPTYIGMSGLARILGVRMQPVNSSSDGLTRDAVIRAISDGSKFGRVRALYDIPDFNNPLGTSLPIERRIELLNLCHDQDILYLEDNAYGMFAYDVERLPTMKSLDTHKSVIYIQSYSKILFPALRLGCLVADQLVDGNRALCHQLSKIKSLLTVNTAGPCQFILANAISSHGDTLEPIVAPKRAHYHRKRDMLLRCLGSEFGNSREFSWNRPSGGFFLTLNLPFDFGRNEFEACAAEYGVIVCPMNFFSLSGKCKAQVRIAFSYVKENDIAEGIRRLSSYCRDRIDGVSSSA